MIDLTKPIEVSCAYPRAEYSADCVPIIQVRHLNELFRGKPALCAAPTSYVPEKMETEAYRRLFENAGKMLAWMKEATAHNALRSYGNHERTGSTKDRGIALIKEIEGNG